MKVNEYSKGEKLFLEKEDAYTGSFAFLSPASQVVIFSDVDWIHVNSTLLHNRVINRVSASFARSILNFLETHYPNLRLTIEIRQRIANVAGKDRDMIFDFLLAGEDRNLDLNEECSECVRFLASHIMSEQISLDFGYKPFSFAREKQGFLQAQVDALRRDFSAQSINESFGIETCGSTREIISFRDRFDSYQGEPIPAKTVFGNAIVDGFRDSDNVVFLRILDDALQVGRKSRTFIVVSANLIDLAIQARNRRLYVEFKGSELFAMGAQKPTFHLEALNLIHSEGPAY